MTVDQYYHSLQATADGSLFEILHITATKPWQVSAYNMDTGTDSSSWQCWCLLPHMLLLLPLRSMDIFKTILTRSPQTLTSICIGGNGSSSSSSRRVAGLALYSLRLSRPTCLSFLGLNLDKHITNEINAWLPAHSQGVLPHGHTTSGFID